MGRCSHRELSLICTLGPRHCIHTTGCRALTSPCSSTPPALRRPPPPSAALRPPPNPIYPPRPPPPLPAWPPSAAAPRAASSSPASPACAWRRQGPAVHTSRYTHTRTHAAGQYWVSVSSPGDEWASFRCRRATQPDSQEVGGPHAAAHGSTQRDSQAGWAGRLGHHTEAGAGLGSTPRQAFSTFSGSMNQQHPRGVGAPAAGRARRGARAEG